MTMAATPTKGYRRPRGAWLGATLLTIALAAPALAQDIYVLKGEDGVELFSNLPRSQAAGPVPSAPLANPSANLSAPRAGAAMAPGTISARVVALARGGAAAGGLPPATPPRPSTAPPVIAPPPVQYQAVAAAMPALVRDEPASESGERSDGMLPTEPTEPPQKGFLGED